MREQNLVLDRKACLLVAEQLRKQRQVEPLARIGGTVQQPCHQRPPDRADVLAIEGKLGELGDANAIGATLTRRVRQFE